MATLFEKKLLEVQMNASNETELKGSIEILQATMTRFTHLNY